MKRIPVCFKDDHYELVTTDNLERLLESGKIKAFRRATGWVIIGQDPLRGKGGSHNGPERRMQRRRQCCKGLKHRLPKVTAQKEQACLTCINYMGGKCVSTVIMVHRKGD